MRAIHSLAVSLAATMLVAATCRQPPAFQEVMLERTKGFDCCIWYRVTISGDGRAEFNSIEDGAVVSRTVARLSPEALATLQRELAAVHYFAFRDSYASQADCPALWMDNPSAITAVRTATRTKRIQHNLGCRTRASGGMGETYPQALTQFENRIEEIARTAEPPLPFPR